jgi:hypothetical protein
MTRREFIRALSHATMSFAFARPQHPQARIIGAR